MLTSNKTLSADAVGNVTGLQYRFNVFTVAAALRSKYTAQLRLHSIQLISSRDIYFGGEWQIQNRRGESGELRFLMKITPESLQVRFSGGRDIPVWNAEVCERV